MTGNKVNYFLFIFKMKDEKLRNFMEEVEDWLNFNKGRLPLNLIDLSKLITIFKRYYILRLKREMKTKKELKGGLK